MSLCILYFSNAFFTLWRFNRTLSQLFYYYHQQYYYIEILFFSYGHLSSRFTPHTCCTHLIRLYLHPIAHNFLNLSSAYVVTVWLPQVELNRKRDTELTKLRKLLEDIHCENEESSASLRKKHQDMMTEMNEQVELTQKQKNKCVQLHVVSIKYRQPLASNFYRKFYRNGKRMSYRRSLVFFIRWSVLIQSRDTLVVHPL